MPRNRDIFIRIIFEKLASFTFSFLYTKNYSVIFYKHDYVMIGKTTLWFISKGSESMIKQKLLIPFFFICILFFIACSHTEKEREDLVKEKESSSINEEIFDSNEPPVAKENTQTEEKREQPDLEKFRREPVEWGESVTGVKTTFKTEKKEIAFTFDACGGKYGNGYDEALIDYLRSEQVPATLFINEQWVHANKETFFELVADPLFQIENHGTNHVPLSINGGEAWDIKATNSVEAAYDEIMDNHETIRNLTGLEMSLFRSGTAYYDEIAVELAKALGYTVVNFDILGDAGATYSREEVKRALLQAKKGRSHYYI